MIRLFAKNSIPKQTLKSLKCTSYAFQHTRSLSTTSETIPSDIWELSVWNPIHYPIYGLQYMHDILGVPYSVSAIIGMLTLRIVTLPLTIAGQRHGARYSHAQPRIRELQLRYEASTQNKGRTAESQKAFQAELHKIRQKYNVSAMGGLMPLLQIPPSFIYFLGMRNVPVYIDEHNAAGRFLDFKDEQVFWITDLTVPDNSWLLPIVSFSACLVASELSINVRKPAKTVKMVQRLFTLVLLPIYFFMPSFVTLYIVPSNIFINLQQVVLSTPFARRMFDIPEMYNSNTDPYASLVKRINDNKSQKKKSPFLKKNK